MRKYFLIIAFMFCLFVSKAEYSGWQYKVNIHFKGGDSTKAFFFAYPELNADSLNNVGHVERYLKRQNKDTLKLDLNRLTYKYKWDLNQNDESICYSLFNNKEFLWKDINSIEVSNYFRSSYAISLETALTFKDTSWCSLSADTVLNIDIELCSYTFCFHQINPEVKSVIKEVSQANYLLISNPWKVLGIDEESNAYGEEISFEQEKIIFRKQQELIKRLYEVEKIVVIVTCTC